MFVNHLATNTHSYQLPRFLEYFGCFLMFVNRLATNTHSYQLPRFLEYFGCFLMFVNRLATNTHSYQLPRFLEYFGCFLMLANHLATNTHSYQRPRFLEYFGCFLMFANRLAQNGFNRHYSKNMHHQICLAISQFASFCVHILMLFFPPELFSIFLIDLLWYMFMPTFQYSNWFHFGRRKLVMLTVGIFSVFMTHNKNLNLNTFSTQTD